ncbi:hypothetical protein EZV62_006534 [Acer yangbiense]|uniref:J domain-containing protein n=1 Tax=Acer yangbiense TaxID=1000413 RepID=A0A5C7I944_9ROSI|nr:hypothetical protein EZV62_006534 [Acer yangbiense]
MDREGVSNGGSPSSSYYTVLGIRKEASFSDVRSAYRKLAMTKRAMYDAGLYDPLEEEDEDFYGFMQEMLTMMNNVKDEGQGESFEDLQRMFVDMVDGGGDVMGFDFDFDFNFNFNHDQTDSKRPRVGGSNGKRSSTRC